MCFGGSPPAPKALPDRQASHAPPVDAQISRSNQRESLRQGFARMILTGPGGVQGGPPATTGKTLLGA